MFLDLFRLFMLDHAWVLLYLCQYQVMITSGLATTHVVDFLWVCKTSYHLSISPPPTNLPNTFKIHTGEKKIDRQSRMWRQYTCYFPAKGSTNLDVFSLKPSLSQGESSLKISACWGSPFWRSQGTSQHTDSLTDRQALLHSDL